jgi:malic enzyme
LTSTVGTVVWSDSCIAFTAGTSTELLQGLTIKLWDDSGSTLAKGTVPAHTLQTLCCAAADNSGTAAVADHSMLDVVVVMQTPASKSRLATATAAAAAIATAASSEQLLAQMSVSCCLRYTAGAVPTATSASEAVIADCGVHDTDMQDMLFDTARSGSADDSAGSDHSADSFEADEPEVYASVSIQDDTAAAIDNSGNSHPQQSSTVAVSDANSSKGVEDEELYMLQMADDETEQ